VNEFDFYETILKRTENTKSMGQEEGPWFVPLGLLLVQQESAMVDEELGRIIHKHMISPVWSPSDS
jgi:hypothetical protein